MVDEPTSLGDDDPEWIECVCGTRFEGETCIVDLMAHVAERYAVDEVAHYGDKRSRKTWFPASPKRR